MKITLFENSEITDLFPIAMTRHISDIRWGKMTIKEKWEGCCEEVILHSERTYLDCHSEQTGLWVLGNLCPDQSLLSAIRELKPGQVLMHDGQMLACHYLNGTATSTANYDSEISQLKRLSDLFSLLGQQIVGDELRLNANEYQHEAPQGVTVIGDKRKLWISTEAKIQPSVVINCTDGPVIIDAQAEVMEGCMVRGPFYLGQKSTLKMGSKVYGPTAIGPECKVGGEVSNVLFLGYSNKAHDGFLGNAVVGEWCNFGADSNCSNLKNNYSMVKQYSYATGKEENTGLTFCGVVMGDHSKCGINTMFNTGTVVGVAANIFGSGFPNKHIPSFSWGGADDLVPYDFEKGIETIRAVKKRRGLELSDREWHVLSEIHRQFGFKK
jgi:UDP-N-acetylglucosamine diphosphorylase/glucosamine-1-phosphate N-acetyltransferase